ncbi:transcriptional adapter 2-alpha isoform X1 [Fopius arisanus]|uniref:Tada2a protein n=1 Tax=Fopius arisanus TaxID=64838 RepID=A0A0C9R674_9HYME|nr:PREDICTED: transcriptional adapter 2-alpha-like isoform X1 [Fopius arisanus]
MSNPAHTDMVEEDAADLQFPKDCRKAPTERDIQSFTKYEIFTSDPTCFTCDSILSEPYIKCAICQNANLCPKCFSQGLECLPHRNDHDYIVIHNEFPLIDSSTWTAKEESDFLTVLQDCGFGNWVDVSKRMPGRSPDDCKSHYLNNYVDNQSLPGLPLMRESPSTLFSLESIPFCFKLQDLEEPPRFATGSSNSRLLAGYNAARSDFDVNFDNHAELLISELQYNEFSPEDEDYRLGTSLQAAIVESYNNRLKERSRRRAIVREHGLIAFRRTMSWLQRYETTITRTTAERLLIFMQLAGGMEFDYILEGLHRAGELKNSLRRLQDYRRNGIKRLHSVPMFRKLLALKNESDRERKIYMGSVECNWRSGAPEKLQEVAVVSGGSSRRQPPPLDIRGLPAEEKLRPEERELCIHARIPPEQYLDHKKLLINENKKMGSLKLAQARTLLKIDVNRTKKLYVFLVEHGWIQAKTS